MKVSHQKPRRYPTTPLFLDALSARVMREVAATGTFNRKTMDPNSKLYHAYGRPISNKEVKIHGSLLLGRKRVSFIEALEAVFKAAGEDREPVKAQFLGRRIDVDVDNLSVLRGKLGRIRSLLA